MEQYDPDIPISQYRQAFNVFYDAGRYANDITPAEKSAVSVFLSGTQQVEAYKAGPRDRLLELEAKRQVKKERPEKEDLKIVHRMQQMLRGNSVKVLVNVPD